MNPTLVRALVDALAFVALSDDETINPDAAVQCLEEVTAELRKLSPSQQADLIAVHRDLESEERASASPERADFLRQLAQNVGD